MFQLRTPCRSATPDDALALAELINIAGEGLPLYLWTKMAASGESPWSVGQQRARRDSGGFSYRHAFVRESGDRVVSALVGYPLPDKPEAIDYGETPAMFVPLQELEGLAAGTWYINALATYPDYRGRGMGADFLSVAEQLAVEANKSGVSLIVSDANSGARRLYERHGYRELATRPMVKEAWENAGNNWILLAKRS